MYVIYFLIAFIATIIGACTGLGGGIIIKPVLSIFTSLDISNINILSSFAVLTLSLIRVIQTVYKKQLIINFSTSMLVVGSIFGGIFGQMIFKSLVSNFSTGDFVTIFQNIVILILFATILIIQFKKPKFYVKPTTISLLLVGLFVGLLGSFLGIGGGPLNMIFLVYMFNFSFKDALNKSMLVILFSQLSSIITIQFTIGLSNFNLSILYIMIPGAIIGALLGGRIVKLLTDKQVGKLFTITISSLMVLIIFSMIRMGLV